MMGPSRKSVRQMPVLSLLVAAFFVLNNEAPAQTPPSPKQLKLNAITTLEQISASDRNVKQTLDKAVKEIRQGLSHRGHDLFLDEIRILPPPDGERVFRGDEQAVERLLEAGRHRRTPQEVKVVFQQVIDSLVRAAREIAQHSIATAQRLVQVEEGSRKKVAKAQWEFERAIRQSKAPKAIGGFGKAWETSQGVVEHSELVIKAFQDGPDPSFAGAGTSTLSVTFQIQNTGKHDHQRHRFPLHLELVWIIQDSGGAVVRSLSSVESLPKSEEKGQGSFDIAMTAVWDGRDDEANVVPSGTYSYIAFGRIVDAKPGRREDDHRSRRREHRSRFWRFGKTEHREEVEAISFPVVETVSVIKLAVTITSPLPGSVINTPTVLVKGVVDALPGTEVGVTVNGAVGLVSGGEFATLVPLNADVFSLTAKASDGSGTTASDSIPVQIEQIDSEPTLFFRSSPPLGIAPQEVRFTLTSLKPIAHVELDLDGDGEVDFEGASLEDLAFHYTAPGLFFPTVAVTDDMGVTDTSKTLVQVFEFGDLDNLLRGKWQGLKNALRSGDIEQAIGFITFSKRENYRRMVTALGPNLASIDQILTDVSFVDSFGARAEYQMIRMDDGIRISHFVLFVMDEDGIWRIRFF